MEASSGLGLRPPHVRHTSARSADSSISAIEKERRVDEGKSLCSGLVQGRIVASIRTSAMSSRFRENTMRHPRVSGPHSPPFHHLSYRPCIKRALFNFYAATPLLGISSYALTSDDVDFHRGRLSDASPAPLSLFPTFPQTPKRNFTLRVSV